MNEDIGIPIDVFGTQPLSNNQRGSIRDDRLLWYVCVCVCGFLRASATHVHVMYACLCVCALT